jgi:nitric-oxide synthase
MEFARAEVDVGREVRARWSWIVPPISGSATPVFHVEWQDGALRPNFYASPKPWEARSP